MISIHDVLIDILTAYFFKERERERTIIFIFLRPHVHVPTQNDNVEPLGLYAVNTPATMGGDNAAPTWNE